MALQQVGDLGCQPQLPRFVSSARSVASQSCSMVKLRARRCGLKVAASSYGDEGCIFKEEPADVVILSNGPGEVVTWVKPVVKALRSSCRHNQILRISVVLAPCPHASGGELELVQTFKEVDRCQGPESFWKLIFLGRTKEAWNWHRKGVCIFLGGDQFNAVVLAKRLGYKTIVYAETAVRWPRFVDRYLVRHNQLLEKLPDWAREKCTVVGDLSDDAIVSGGTTFEGCNPEGYAVVGILPGSKPVKLSIGVPYFMSVAEHLHQRIVFIDQGRMGGHVKFLLPLAPTVNPSKLAKYVDAELNPVISRFNWTSGELQLVALDTNNGKLGTLVTRGGLKVDIWQQFPPYDLFRQCTLCLTTVGANTAELGSLSIPMIVVLPTHALEVFKGGTGGVLGMLSNIPGWIGDKAARAVNSAIINSAGFIAWPNRWAGEQVVPELIGRIEPEEVAEVAAHFLKDRNALEVMKQKLSDLKGARRNPYSNSDACTGGAACIGATTVHQLLRNE